MRRDDVIGAGTLRDEVLVPVRGYAKRLEPAICRVRRMTQTPVPVRCWGRCCRTETAVGRTRNFKIRRSMPTSRFRSQLRAPVRGHERDGC